jgi:hypothetical protein
MTEKEFIAAVAHAISNATAPHTAATGVYGICRDYAEACGMKPDIEVALREPGEPRCYGTDGSWYVSFEAGPYEWAVAASLNVDPKGDVLAEPYYSFDLCFSEAR